MYVRKATLPFGLALAGGILILVFSAIQLALFALLGGFFLASLLLAFSILGVISGIIIIVGATIAHEEYRSQTTCGIVIIVMSSLSFLASGGFIVGAILGILGGIFFIAWKHIPPSLWDVAACPYCRTQVSIGHTYCPNCGSRFHTPGMMQQPAHLYYQPAKQYPSWSQDIQTAPTACKKCGSELPKRGRFCPKCGAPRVSIKK